MVFEVIILGVNVVMTQKRKKKKKMQSSEVSISLNIIHYDNFHILYLLLISRRIYVLLELKSLGKA